MEEILVPLIVFSFLGFILKSIIDYRKWKLSHQHGINEPGGESSLTQSELKALVQSAVEDAIEPLQAEIAALRNEQNAAALERVHTPLLAGTDAEADADSPGAVPVQRSRQHSA